MAYRLGRPAEVLLHRAILSPLTPLTHPIRRSESPVPTAYVLIGTLPVPVSLSEPCAGHYDASQRGEWDPGDSAHMHHHFHA